MASLGQIAGAGLMEPSDDFSPIPAGVYDAEVVESDVVPTKNNDGTIVKITLKVTSGQFENRRIWANVNIQNHSDVAQEIGQRQLSDLARATGFAAIPSNTEDFHGIPIRINVKLTPGNGQYGPKNEVSRYMPLNGSEASAPRAATTAPAARAPQAAQATGGAKPTWMARKAG